MTLQKKKGSRRKRLELEDDGADGRDEDEDIQEQIMRNRMGRGRDYANDNPLRAYRPLRVLLRLFNKY